VPIEPESARFLARRGAKHAQPHPVALSHVSLAGVDLSAELPRRLEVVRRHFGPVLRDVDYRARMIVKLPGNPWSAPTLKPPPRVLLGEPGS
jgi:hypothetical protein